MSIYAFVTFIVSLSVFTLFIYYFVTKVRYDARHFEQRVQKEVEKRHSQEQLLLRQYRMQNMGEMIDAIAHQWRQPLMQSNMILLNIEEELDNKPYVEEKMQELIVLNTHMSQTIDDFRHLLHDSQEKITFNIAKSIDEVRMLMQHQLKEIDVVCQCNESDEIVGYKNELMQIFIILLSNAVEALKNNNIQEKKIKISTSLNESDVTIKIEDNAGGIEENVIDKIFDPYFSTKKNSGGTGLGLYIAKLITEETMHGNLSVTQGTQGAKFTIIFMRSL
jgi:signal transduction histidine kinase